MFVDKLSNLGKVNLRKKVNNKNTNDDTEDIFCIIDTDQNKNSSSTKEISNVSHTKNVGIIKNFHTKDYTKAQISSITSNIIIELKHLRLLLLNDILDDENISTVKNRIKDYEHVMYKDANTKFLINEIRVIIEVRLEKLSQFLSKKSQ